eukprot:7065219-Pyramimonas_sp.AAC.1
MTLDYYCGRVRSFCGWGDQCAIMAPTAGRTSGDPATAAPRTTGTGTANQCAPIVNPCHPSPPWKLGFPSIKGCALRPADIRSSIVPLSPTACL